MGSMQFILPYLRKVFFQNTVVEAKLKRNVSCQRPTQKTNQGILESLEAYKI